MDLSLITSLNGHARAKDCPTCTWYIILCVQHVRPLTFGSPELEVVQLRHVHGGVLEASGPRVGRRDERQERGHGARGAEQQRLHPGDRPVIIVLVDGARPVVDGDAAVVASVPAVVLVGHPRSRPQRGCRPRRTDRTAAVDVVASRGHRGTDGEQRDDDRHRQTVAAARDHRDLRHFVRRRVGTVRRVGTAGRSSSRRSACIVTLRREQ